MTSIDWSKAPEDATHGGVGRIPFWVKGLTENGFMFMNQGDPRWLEAQGAPKYPLSPRPTGWNGEGLPPVGTVCEYNNFEPHPVSVDLKWSPVRIVAHDEQGGDVFAVFSSLSGYHGTRKVECFRPIRTAEQIAADEREKEVHGMLAHMRGPDRTPVDLAMALYDAGYRKQVQP